MREGQQLKALAKKVKELTKALQLARLQADGLETTIKMAEEQLQTSIQKGQADR